MLLTFQLLFLLLCASIPVAAAYFFQWLDRKRDREAHIKFMSDHIRFGGNTRSP